MFLSTDDPERILELIQAYPKFQELYDDIYTICCNTERVMEMFSEELKILDDNTVQYMIDVMQEKLDSQEKQINTQAEQLATKDQQITDQAQQLNVKDQQITAQAQQLNAKNQQLSDLAKQLEEMKKLLAQAKAQPNSEQ